MRSHRLTAGLLFARSERHRQLSQVRASRSPSRRVEEARLVSTGSVGGAGSVVVGVGDLAFPEGTRGQIWDRCVRGARKGEVPGRWEEESGSCEGGLLSCDCPGQEWR